MAAGQTSQTFSAPVLARKPASGRITSDGTGGVVQYVEGFPGGVAGFVARADALADRYGERFRVPASLRARAAA